MFGFRAAAFGAAVLALALSASASAQEGRYARLYETLWGTVNGAFYDPHFRGVDWAAQRDAYRARAMAAQNDTEFAAIANAMLGELGVSHLYLTPPGVRTDARGIGARLATSGEDTIVTHVSPLSDAARQGLRPGDRLLSPLEAVSGDLGSQASLRVQTCEGRRRTLEVRRENVGFGERPGLRWQAMRANANLRIGYIRVDRFDDGAAEMADAAMAALADTQAIIVDVRENSGGNISALRLASHFGGGAEPAVALMARPYLQALGQPVNAEIVRALPRVDRAYTDAAVFGAVSANRGGASFWTETVETPYRGRVFVLISPETSSAAEGFARYMRERTQARLIGEQTAGYLLSGQNFDLGEGWRVTIPVHGLWSADGVDQADRAVAPHDAVRPSRADLCAGRDAVLAEALRQAEAP
ncbi:MAG TPA: S41 family peptidase [Terricaulis sp.]|nr:S41 family peptidase [Terricaulis sp.]